MSKANQKKRVISVGLVKPLSLDLEGSVIYVSLESQKNGFKITAVSTGEFQYHCRAFDGKARSHRGKETTMIMVPRKNNRLSKIKIRTRLNGYD